MPPKAYCSNYSQLEGEQYDATAWLELCTAANQKAAVCPVTGISITTPLNARKWAQYLVATRYPSIAGAATLIARIRQGVDLGYYGERTGVSVGPNLPSAIEHKPIIDRDMLKQKQLGRREGPLDKLPSFDFFRANPLGVVFKKGNALKPRVVHHLSWPRNGASVNKSITDFNITLDAYDRAVEALRACGRGAHMGKIDIEAAYRCIPVRPADWPLQGMTWEGKFLFDIVMQFGLASATAIFEWYSSAAEHIAKRQFSIEHLVHYVDDFFTMHKHEEGCKLQLDRIVALFTELGLPVAPGKLEGPCTSMIFLGILFNSIDMTVSLSAERLEEIERLLADWSQRRQASREQLQELIGILAFAAKVVRSSRIFLRRMIDQLKRIPSAANHDKPYPLSDEFFADLRWWSTFMRTWNGVALISDSSRSCNEVHTDACSTGYSAVWRESWYAGTWTRAEEQEARRSLRDSMPWKEMHAVVRAAATFGQHWRGTHVLFHCDCECMVKAVQKGSSTKPAIATLIRTLYLIAAQHDFTFNMQHIAGEMNVYADLLSRGQVTPFKALQGRHSPSPTTCLPLPTQIW